MQIVRIKDLDKDFWEQNQALKVFSPFAEFSKTKDSGKIMTAIYLIYDAKSPSRIASLNLEDVIADVNLNYLKDKKFNWTKYSKIIEAYKEFCTSDIHKRLDNLKAEADRITTTLSTLELSDEVDSKIFKDLYGIRNSILSDVVDFQLKYEQEVGEQQLYGEYEPSGIEQRGLEIV